MITLDASFLIALLSEYDSHHRSADDWIRTNLGRRMRLHPITLAEVLVGPARSGIAEQVLAGLENLGIHTSTPRQAEPLSIATLRAQTGLPIPDCCVLSCALEQGHKIATFDRGLSRAATGLGVDVVTEQAI